MRQSRFVSPIYCQPGRAAIGRAAAGMSNGPGEPRRAEASQPWLNTCENQIHRNPVGYLQTMMIRRHGHANLDRLSYSQPEVATRGKWRGWSVIATITLPEQQVFQATGYGHTQKKAKRSAAKDLIKILNW